MSNDIPTDEPGHAEPVVRSACRPFLQAFLIAFVFQAILVSGLFFGSFCLELDAALLLGWNIYCPWLYLWDDLVPWGGRGDIGWIAVAVLCGMVVYASLFGLLARFVHHDFRGGKERGRKNGSSAA
jgi:hypothetical protein